MGIAALAGLLVPHIPGLIRLVEGAIRKPKAGVDKKDAVIQALRSIITKSTLVNGDPPNTITDDELGGLIEGVFQNLNNTVPSEVPPQKLYLLKGSLQEITSVNV